jgi:hypothetical protein
LRRKGGARREAALALIEEAFRLTKATLGPDHPYTRDTLRRFALFLLEARRPGDAEPLLRECLASGLKTRADHWTTFNTQSLLGACLLAQQKYAEAEPLLRQGYEGLKRRTGTIPANDKVRLSQAVERLVQLYEATGQKAKADEWRQKLEEMKAAAKPRAKP